VAGWKWEAATVPGSDVRWKGDLLLSVCWGVTSSLVGFLILLAVPLRLLPATRAAA
jgi:hypothetical protein